MNKVGDTNIYLCLHQFIHLHLLIYEELIGHKQREALPWCLPKEIFLPAALRSEIEAAKIIFGEWDVDHNEGIGAGWRQSQERALNSSKF